MIRKFRILTFALIFSGGLNIGLIAALLVKSLDDKKMILPQMKTNLSLDTSVNCREVLFAFKELSFAELLVLLTNRDLVDEGLSKRDLALASLVRFHLFDLDKALSFEPLERRAVMLDEHLQLDIFPALTEAQFDAVIRFAYQEKWPLTPRGLFSHLLKRSSEESLKEAFYLTPHFEALHTLFQKTGSQLSKEGLLALCLEGNFETLEAFLLEQTQVLDLSIDRRRMLLLSYLQQGSSKAADLLVQTDFAFVRQKLDDPELAQVLALLPSHELTERLCREIASSVRPDVLREQARGRLQSAPSEAIVQPFTTKQEVKKIASLAEAPFKGKEYVVKKGDTLWKIAKVHQVTIREILESNGLEQDRLLPGMVLYIPKPSERSGS